MNKTFSIIFLISILLSCNKKNIENDINHFYDKAFDFLEKKNEDSAYVYFDKAKDIFQQKGNKVKEGKCLINMAIISTNKGDYYGGQAISLEASKLFNENNRLLFSDICSNYNNLGIASNNLKDYKNAIRFYYETIKFSDNKENKLIVLNNIANVYKEQKDYNNASKIYLDILKEIKNTNNQLYPTIITNLAITKWLSNSTYNPEAELLKALQIRKKQNDLWGQNSSHSHLSEYYSKKAPEKALLHAKEMFYFSKKNNNPDDQLEALQKLIFLDPENRLSLFKEYQHLTDSLQTIRSKAKNQFALIRFDVEKQKLENEQLKSVNLKKNIGIIALASLLISGTFWYIKRKKRLQQEKELEVKNTELKMSKKVHDKVANKVYHVMSEVENVSEMDKEILLDKLESIYHISRDISYEGKDPVLENNFSQHLYQMLNSYASETIKISTIGNEESFWQGLSDNSKVETFYILQELMTNMKKHSQANRVLINFERESKIVSISYSDNGIGIQTYSPKNGLQNTGTRIKSIGGKINFDTKTEKGLKITLSFPIKN